MYLSALTNAIIAYAAPSCAILNFCDVAEHVHSDKYSLWALSLTSVVNASAKATTPATLVVLSNLTGSVPLFANEVISENVKLSLVGHLESTELSMCMSRTLVCSRKCEVVIGGTSDETFDVHVMRPWLSVNVVAGGGETGSPPPKAPRLSLQQR